jgi:hypothetical protein
VRAYAALAGITVLNPLTVVYWTALVLGHQASAQAFTLAQAGVLVLAVIAASAGWLFLLVGGGALVGRLASSRRGILAASLASSVLIAALAVRILKPVTRAGRPVSRPGQRPMSRHVVQRHPDYGQAEHAPEPDQHGPGALSRPVVYPDRQPACRR